MKRALLWVQHLLGLGHVQRAARLAKALAADGSIDVTVACGGPPTGIVAFGRANLAQLPAASAADARFAQLLDEGGNPVTEAWWAHRCAALARLAAEVGPDIVITELFPFGRRAFRRELLPVLDDLKARERPPQIVSSVRDILVAPLDPEKVQLACGLFDRYFGRLLVHADPAFVRLEDSWPGAERLGAVTTYTGYITEVGPSDSPAVAGGVLVSAGNGRVGERLVETAIAARRLSMARTLPWRILCGPAVRTLPQSIEPGIVVEQARPDFAALLAACAVSVSQAGYNTVMEVLANRKPAVLVPFAAGAETEQTMRAAGLARRGLAEVVSEAELAPASLAAAIDRALAAPPLAAELRLNGAEESARLVRQWLGSA
jgi:predicted glycosyltransferase